MPCSLTCAACASAIAVCCLNACPAAIADRRNCFSSDADNCSVVSEATQCVRTVICSSLQLNRDYAEVSNTKNPCVERHPAVSVSLSLSSLHQYIGRVQLVPMSARTHVTKHSCFYADRGQTSECPQQCLRYDDAITNPPLLGGGRMRVPEKLLCTCTVPVPASSASWSLVAT